MNDLMALKSLKGDGLTPYEQYKVANMQSKRPSGVGIAGLAVGIGAAVAAIGAGAWAGAKAQNAKDVATAKNDGLKDLVTTIAGSLAAERQERIAGDVNITATINDTQTGSQQSTLSQALSNDIALGVMTGKYSENPQKVELMTPAKPFQCGCGD